MFITTQDNSPQAILTRLNIKTPKVHVYWNYDYMLKDILISREDISLYSGTVHMTLRFSVVDAYSKPLPAAPGQGRYKVFLC